MNTYFSSLKTFAVSFLVIFILSTSCSNEGNEKLISENVKNEVIVASVVVKNENIRSSGMIPGQINYSVVREVSFALSGKIEQGDVSLKEGQRFKFNDLLFKLNMEEAFHSLNVKKADLTKRVQELQTTIGTKFPSETAKWEKFAIGLSPAKRLPEFPIIHSEEERKIMIQNEVSSQFNEIKSLEVQIENYFYLAPFDGVLLSVLKSPNYYVKQGVSVAKIAKLKAFIVNFSLPIEVYNELNKKETIEFFNDQKVKIGTGKIKDANLENGEMKVVFSFQAQNGAQISLNQIMYVKVLSSVSKGIYLPMAAVKNGNVSVLVNGKKQSLKISVLSQKDNLVFVSGLEDGTIVLIN